jgi:hypothetical protein
MSSQRNCYFFFDHTATEGFSKPKTHQKTKWVLMRLDATTLTEKQICNFKHTEEKQKLVTKKTKK